MAAVSTKLLNMSPVCLHEFLISWTEHFTSATISRLQYQFFIESMLHETTSRCRGRTQTLPLPGASNTTMVLSMAQLNTNLHLRSQPSHVAFLVLHPLLRLLALPEVELPHRAT
jgi:hypothetical protein